MYNSQAPSATCLTVALLSLLYRATAALLLPTALKTVSQCQWKNSPNWHCAQACNDCKEATSLRFVVHRLSVIHFTSEELARQHRNKQRKDASNCSACCLTICSELVRSLHIFTHQSSPFLPSLHIRPILCWIHGKCLLAPFCNQLE